MAASALTLLRLTDDERAVLGELQRRVFASRPKDIKHERYYQGRQRLALLGIAVPPELAGFETVVNWPRVGVDEIEHRMDVRAFVRPGNDKADEELREAAEANNLDSEFPLLHRQTLKLGRGFASVSTNPDDKDMPHITVESSREIAVTVDTRTRTITAALRLYKSDGAFVMFNRATLYLPNTTLWLETGGPGGWKVVDRDDHNLGRVAIVIYLNRREIGDWLGESEMTDLMPITDAAARSLTNLQLAQETHAVPPRYVLGITKGDFVDKDGKQLPAWEAYYDRFMATANKDAKIGQLDQADLSNFHDTVMFYGKLASSVSGLPTRYFGDNPANPATEGAIRADESRLIKNTERKMSDAGSQHGLLMALWLRFKTGEWVDGNRVSTLWYDAGTPTFSQRADALQKLAGGKPLISREGAWDELGWSEARKDRERGYFEAEDQDPQITAANRKLAELAAPPVVP
ncbi:MAG: hypothetical protein JWP85_2124 [Rhodoglobus sp.]|nr:hypothetical protein [Rhodoglobus sp.]